MKLRTSQCWLKIFWERKMLTLLHIRILRRSIDSRQERIDLVYTLLIELAAPGNALKKILARSDVETFTEPQETAPVAITGLTVQAGHYRLRPGRTLCRADPDRTGCAADTYRAGGAHGTARQRR